MVVHDQDLAAAIPAQIADGLTVPVTFFLVV
jgi:hypothetical protein